MAKRDVLIDSLTQFTADFLKFAAAETRYFEHLGRCGGALGDGAASTTSSACPQLSNGPTNPPPSASSDKPTAKPSKQKNKLVNGGINYNANTTTSTTKSQKTSEGDDHDADDHIDASSCPGGGLSALSKQVALAREQIASSLKKIPSGVAPSEDDIMIREENQRLKQQLEQLQSQVSKLTDRVTRLESKLGDAPSGGGDSKKAVPSKNDADDDVDLFGSDNEEEDAEAAKLKEERLAAYAAKKSAKPGVIAKSNVILDVKPWDDETDMKELERAVRSIVMDGLLWGVSKLVPVGYGILKLQIATVVEDDKVSIDELVEKLQDFEDFIQSVDIAAFNKI